MSRQMRTRIPVLDMAIAITAIDRAHMGEELLGTGDAVLLSFDQREAEMVAAWLRMAADEIDRVGVIGADPAGARRS